MVVKIMDNKIKKIGNFVSSLLLGETKEMIIRTDETVKRIDKDIEGIDKDIEEIKKDVKQLSNRAFRLETATVELQVIIKSVGGRICQSLEVSPGSPLKLTSYGEEIAKRIDGYKFVEDNKNLLFSFIEAKKHNTNYDVQAAARKILDENLSNPIMNGLKSFAYTNGMDIGIILNVVGIILRDEYLKAHPEIE
jgi:t-SNARE complex subunit (syntaxin)